jgi:hypothetical protein
MHRLQDRKSLQTSVCRSHHKSKHFRWKHFQSKKAFKVSLVAPCKRQISFAKNERWPEKPAKQKWRKKQVDEMKAQNHKLVERIHSSKGWEKPEGYLGPRQGALRNQRAILSSRHQKLRREIETALVLQSTTSPINSCTGAAVHQLRNCRNSRGYSWEPSQTSVCRSHHNSKRFGWKYFQSKKTFKVYLVAPCKRQISFAKNERWPENRRGKRGERNK